METLHPGLYMLEVPGESPIEGVSTSTGAFVGITERGPVGKSGFVSSWNDFVSQYGGYLNTSHLAYAVRGFFENGGTRAFISRVIKFNAGVKSSKAATIDLKLDATKVALLVDAKYDGAYGNKITVKVENVAAPLYDLKIFEKGVLQETYTKLSQAKVEETVNSQSSYVRVTVIDASAPPLAINVDLAQGNDGTTGLTATDYVGDPATKTGLYAFDNDAINMVAVPGNTDPAVIAALKSYTEKRQDCVAITEVPFNKKPTEAKTYRDTTPGLASERVNVYYPWVRIADPIGIGTSPVKVIPPSGHIMGVFARTDADRGVWKAPAGMETGIRGVIGAEININDAEHDILNPIGVNAIRQFPGEGVVVWGARTGATNEFRYVPVRRSVDFVEQSVLAGTRWAVFEPNDAELYGKIRATVEGFLRGYWQSGGLKGDVEDEAYFVQCDETTTSDEDREAGRVYANIGLATRKPAEFIVFRVSLRK